MDRLPSRSRHYVGLLAALDSFPQAREAVLRWAAETGTDPSDAEAWEAVSAAYLGTLAGMQIVSASETESLRKSANRLQFASDGIEKHLELLKRESSTHPGLGLFPGDIAVLIAGLLGCFLGALLMYFVSTTFLRCAV